MTSDIPKGGADAGAVLRVSQGGSGPVGSPAGLAGSAGRGASKGPIDPRLVRRAAATRWYLVGGVAIGSVIAVLTVVQAWVLSTGIAAVFDAAPGLDYLTPIPGTGAWPALGWFVGVLGVVFGGKALLMWLNTLLAHRAAAAVKSQLRRDIMAARLARPLDSGESTAGLVNLVTRGLDALDGFYSKYLPQLVLAVTVPLIVGVAILWADLGAAVIVALTLPLIPLFMMLVGWTTEARTKKRWRTQQRLARHFADLVAGLPTLQVFGRARAQAIGLQKTEDAHRGETMGTLRISFMSALVLELLATLSVAVVAVTVGFRVVAGGLDLQTALFVLILAPEAFLPVRQVGVHYHDSVDGMAAAESAFALIDGPPTRRGPGVSPPRTGVLSAEDRGFERRGPGAAVGGLAGSGRDTQQASRHAGSVPGVSGHSLSVVAVNGLGHTYPGADRPAVQNISFNVAPGEFVVLTGPSGGGKTTVLNALLGFLEPTEGTATRPPREAMAYVGQHPGMIAGTVADNVRLGDPSASDAAVADALARAGASEIDPEHPVGDEAEGLSSGERRRVATARALLRVDAGAQLLLLDEPTAGLDADAEATLLRSLRGRGVAAVVVSHRPAVIAEADRVVVVDNRRSSADELPVLGARNPGPRRTEPQPSAGEGDD